MKNSGKKQFGKRTLSNLLVVCSGVLLYILLSNFGAVRGFFAWLGGVLFPFVSGLAIAYLLNIPVRFFETRVFSGHRRRHGLSVLVAYLLAFLLLGVLLVLVLPQVVESIVTLGRNVPGYLANLNRLLEQATVYFGLEPESYQTLLFSYQDVVTRVVQQVRAALPSLLNWTVRIGTGIIGGLTALIASVYMLLARDKLVFQMKKVLYALLPKRRADEALRVGRLANGVFSGFIGGKIIDSAIIGSICFVFMTVMNAFFVPMPFAPLISIVVGVTNIIPFFGPFIGAIPSLMILLLIDPFSALWFLVFIILLQQFDGNYLGPKILGDSTGLPALWVLIAIVVGGGMFGFPGMVLGVPTAAVLYTLASDFVAVRLRRKGLRAQGGDVAAAAGPEDPPEAGKQGETPL